jgi:membrane protease YdiL (CAAX protease family)
LTAQSLIRGHISRTVGLAILSLLVFGAYLLGYRVIERRHPPELSGLTSLKEFFAGLALGVALFSAVIAVLWLFRVYHLQSRGTAAGLGAGALSALLAATVEETLIRGFLFRIVQMLGGTWIAILISSAFFGAGHAFNPGATVTSSLAIALEAGVLLAAAYLLTGRLSFPMGLHGSWNFSEGSLYGLFDLRLRRQKRAHSWNPARSGNSHRRRIRSGSLHNRRRTVPWHCGSSAVGCRQNRPHTTAALVTQQSASRLERVSSNRVPGST